MNIRICFVSSVYPPTTMGGVERYLLNILEILKKRDTSSTVLTRYYPPLPTKEDLSNYSVKRIGLYPLPYFKIRYISTFLRFIEDKFNYSFLGYFQSLKYINRVDVINSQLGYKWDVYLANKLAAKMRKKHVITIHGRFGYQLEDIIPSRYLIKSLRNADFLIVNRNQSFNFLLGRGFENIKLMRNSIPVSKYKNPKGSPGYDTHEKIIVLFIGRLCYRRGAHLAIEAFIIAARKCPDLELWVVGKGPLENKLKTLVNNLHVKKRVKFLGQQFDTRKLLWKSHIFLALSPIANSPSLSLREAMASGLAIIATDVEETNKIIETNKNGILVHPEIQSIKNGILKLAYNEKLRKKVSVSASDYAEQNFDINKYVDQLVELYTKL